MLPEIERILLPRDVIAERVAQLGRELSAHLESQLRAEGEDAFEQPDRVVMVPVLTGAIVFAADLIRQVPLRLSIRLVTVSSYPGQSVRSKGASLRGALPTDLAGRHVVLIDDILDSGQTLALLRELVEEQGPASVRTCVLLSKKVERVAETPAELVGFEIPDEFVVGYGLDYDGLYRNLPDIVTLDSDALHGARGDAS